MLSKSRRCSSKLLRISDLLISLLTMLVLCQGKNYLKIAISWLKKLLLWIARVITTLLKKCSHRCSSRTMATLWRLHPSLDTLESVDWLITVLPSSVQLVSMSLSEWKWESSARTLKLLVFVRTSSTLACSMVSRRDSPCYYQSSLKNMLLKEWWMRFSRKSQW